MMLEHPPEGIIYAQYREALHDLMWQGEVREWDKKGRLKPKRLVAPDGAQQPTPTGSDHRSAALRELAALNAQIAELQAGSQQAESPPE